MNSAKHLQPESSANMTGLPQPDSRPGGAAIEAIVANIAALAQVRQDTPSLNASIQDWDMMFRAVEERLGSAVGKGQLATAGLEPQSAALQVQTVVLECVQALGQLHAALTCERDGRQQLEQKIADAQAALAAGLVGSPPAEDPGRADLLASAQSGLNGGLRTSATSGVFTL